ncbi:MAG TPA: hypothetical protein VHE12_11595 [bacterium]|nr:hypothetical protein [bacterium]
MPSSGLKHEDPLNPSLTPLEQAVMDRLLAGEHPILTALRKQLENATISSRQFSGVGFFTYFRVPETVPHVPSPNGRLIFGDVNGEIKGVKHGAGFVLFLDQTGYLDMLEGYTYDDNWPEDTSDFKLSYNDPTRKKLMDYLEEEQKGKG